MGVAPEFKKTTALEWALATNTRIYGAMNSVRGFSGLLQGHNDLHAIIGGGTGAASIPLVSDNQNGFQFRLFPVRQGYGYPKTPALRVPLSVGRD